MLKVIKLSKAEQQARMSDPDWVYMPKGHIQKQLKKWKKAGKKMKGKIDFSLISTPADKNNHKDDFKKIWE